MLKYRGITVKDRSLFRAKNHPTAARSCPPPHESRVRRDWMGWGTMCNRGYTVCDDSLNSRQEGLGAAKKPFFAVGSLHLCTRILLLTQLG